jgi:catechol 2,3-dioxygenase-like lactoylglutathione lyase family enzyme
MENKNAELNACAIVLMTEDINKTAQFYQDKLNFEVVKHLANEERFAACYRDNVELVLVETKKGTIESNSARYGAGYDAYLVTEDVDKFYKEIKEKDIKVVQKPKITEYGSKEFKIEDIDGRIIGIGKIQDYDQFFKRK